MCHWLLYGLITFSAPGDYVEETGATLTIPFGAAQSLQRCRQVLVVGDLVREDDEIFTVRITPENSNDVITQSFRVVILDDGDGRCVRQWNTRLKALHYCHFIERPSVCLILGGCMTGFTSGGEACAVSGICTQEIGCSDWQLFKSP